MNCALKINNINNFNLLKLTKKLLSKNLYTVSLYLRKLASAFTVFFLARYLSVSEYGLYSSYVNITAMILLFVNFGFNEYILVSSKNRLKEVRLKLAFFMILAFILMLVMILFANCFNLLDKIIFSLILVRSFLDGNVFALILTYYQSANKFKEISIINIIYSVWTLITACAAYIFKLKLSVFLILCILIGIANLIYSSIVGKLNYMQVFLKFKRFVKMIDAKLLYYGLVMVTVWIYYQIPSLSVSLFLEKTQAAIYFAAFNIFSILLLISAAQVQQIMPKMIVSNNRQLLASVKKNILYIVSINMGIFILFILFGKFLLLLLYGRPEYLASYPLLLIGAFGNIFMSAGGVLACFMTSKGFQKNKFHYQLEFIVIALVLSFAFHRLGILGATITYTLISMYAFTRYLIFTLIKLKDENVSL